MEELYVLTKWGCREPIWFSEGKIVREAGTLKNYTGLTLKEMLQLCKERNWKLEKFEEVEWGK